MNHETLTTILVTFALILDTSISLFARAPMTSMQQRCWKAPRRRIYLSYLELSCICEKAAISQISANLAAFLVQRIVDMNFMPLFSRIYFLLLHFMPLVFIQRPSLETEQVRMSLCTSQGAIQANFMETPPPKLQPLTMHFQMPLSLQNYLRSRAQSLKR